MADLRNGGRTRNFLSAKDDAATMRKNIKSKNISSAMKSNMIDSSPSSPSSDFAEPTSLPRTSW